MAKKYFGTDGVRGEVGQFPITPEFVLKLGYAAGRVLVHHDGKGRPTVLIGKDTRISGYMLEAAGGGVYRGGCERHPNRPAAHARRGLSNPCAASGGRRDDFRLA